MSGSRQSVVAPASFLLWGDSSRYRTGRWGSPLEQPVLLLVENDALVLLAAMEALRAGGHAVVVATNGHEALAAFENPSTELAGLVTDIALGSVPDGWEVARQAREIQADCFFST